MNEDFSALELRLFGTFEGRVNHVSLASFRSPKSKLLLAFLTLHSGQPVSTSVIADAIFPDSQATDPHEIIKKTVQDTRRVLEAQAYRLYVTAPRTLALNLEGAQVDWLVFHAALKEGNMESLQQAVALHSRPFLEEEAHPWVIAEQARCLKLRQGALDTLFRQAMDREETADAASRLTQMLAFDAPYLLIKEELWRDFLHLCARRQEFGLLHHHYTQLQKFLERTAGRLPEPETQALHQQIPRPVLLQILQHRERKKKRALPACAPFPLFPFPLLGRELEKQELKEALVDTRLITLVGTGGVGKTRLAVHIAQEIGGEGKQETGFVDLTASSPQNLLQSVAFALGVKESANIPLYRALSDFLRAKAFLLLLDNCEHLIEAAAKLCADLLRDCPNLRLLATSRETLRVDSEQVFALLPLALPSANVSDWETCRETPAVRLFVERAASAAPYFQLTPQNAPLIMHLCRLVDGLPLGIEMIASQAADMPLKSIAAELADCLLHLEHRRRGVVPRHRSLLSVLEWSHSLLSAPEQILMRRLAVFTGGWTLQAAEQVCSDEALPLIGIARLLSDLAAKSLIVMAISERDTVRYYFLEAVRAYADEHLSEAGERKSLERRSLNYFVSLTEEAERQISSAQQKEWLEILDSEYANLRHSLQISVADAEDNVEGGLRLAWGLQRYWEMRGYSGEGREWCSALLAKTEATDRSVARTRVIDAAGWFASTFGDYTKASALLHESLERFRVQGQEKDASLTLLRLGLVKVNLQDYEGARTCFEESLAIRRELKDKRLIALALLNLGQADFNLADYPQARTCYEEALSLLMEAEEPRTRATCLSNLARLAMQEEDYPLASSLFEESLAISEEMGDKHLMRFTQYNIANMAIHTGNVGKAYSAYMQCLQLSQEAQVFSHIIGSLEGVSNVLVQQELWERGIQVWGAAVGLARDALHAPRHLGAGAA